jgi:parallel beta-helix repeat protein
MVRFFQPLAKLGAAAAFLLANLVAAAGIAAAAPPSTVYVSSTNCSASGPGTKAHPYCTIQQGVNAANNGDTVMVLKGTYNAPVNVDKSITLEGAGATVNTGGVDGMTLNANDITVENFKFAGNSAGPGVSTFASFSGYRILNNTFTNNVFGLYLNSSGMTQTVVKANTFNNNNQTGAANGNGIYSDQGLQDSKIDANKFTNQMNAAILVVPGNQTVINGGIDVVNNSIRNGSGAGVTLAAVTDSGVSNNDIRNLGGNGVMLVEGGSGNTINNNYLSNNFRGIRLGHSGYGPGVLTNTTVSGNFIRNSADSGIYVAPDSLTNSTIKNTTSNNNQADGVLVDMGNNGNTIEDNSMHHNSVFDAQDNTTGTSTAGTDNSWIDNSCKTSQPTGLCS